MFYSNLLLTNFDLKEAWNCFTSPRVVLTYQVNLLPGSAAVLQKLIDETEWSELRKVTTLKVAAELSIGSLQ